VLRLLSVLALVLCAVPALAQTRVVAVTADLAALANAVGGADVVVQTLIPPGADPEAFEPRPVHFERLRGVQLAIRVGLGFDAWLDRMLAQLGDARLRRGGAGHVDASLGVAQLEVRGRAVVEEPGHAHGHANPHYWLDPENARTITANIAEALIRQAPAVRDRVVANRDRFLAELDARLPRWRAQLVQPGVKLIAYHNSWPYFARRFRLDIVDFIEPKPGVAPSPAHLARLVEKGRALGVRAILHEPHEPEDASRLVAAKLGIPVVRLATSVGALPEAKNYLALFDHNVAALAAALGSR
jgi:ABC-type Zn uptake system ZnuABC Zn-binding protein ZnuA